MQITADVNEMSKNVPRDLTFIPNVYPQSGIHFFLTERNVLSFILNYFY